MWLLVRGTLISISELCIFWTSCREGTFGWFRVPILFGKSRGKPSKPPLFSRKDRPGPTWAEGKMAADVSFATLHRRNDADTKISRALNTEHYVQVWS